MVVDSGRSNSMRDTSSLNFREAGLRPAPEVWSRIVGFLSNADIAGARSVPIFNSIISPRITVNSGDSHQLERHRRVHGEHIEPLVNYPEDVVNTVTSFLIVDGGLSDIGKLALAKAKTTTAANLNVLACDKNVDVMRAVAGNTSASYKTLAVLARDHKCLRAVVAGNPSAKKLTRDLLASSASPASRNYRIAARSPGARLSSERSSLDRMGLGDPWMDPRNQDHYSARRWSPAMVEAGNPSTSAERLGDLAQNLSEERAAVARDPNTRVEALCVLAADDESVVRAAVADNPLVQAVAEQLSRSNEWALFHYYE